MGRTKILDIYKKNSDIQENLSAAAHLMHGSSDGRFNITYATKYLTKEEVEGVNYNHMDLDAAIKKYDPDKLKDGYNTLDDGEEIFFISNPATGLWRV